MKAAPSHLENQDLSGRVRQLRSLAGLTVAGLAELSGCDQSYIYRIENGLAMNPSRVFIRRLAAALGVDAAWLQTGQRSSPIAERQDTKGTSNVHRVGLIRQRIGWTQSEMAEYLGITRSYLSQVENTRRVPSQDLVAKAERAHDEFTAGQHPADYRGAPVHPISGELLKRVGDQDPAAIYRDLDSFLAGMTEQELRISLAFFWSGEPRKVPVAIICERVASRLLRELSQRSFSRSSEKPDGQAGA